ncbi:MAG: YggS family pyridoxal phosphate-dependent enzyme [Clostridiales bacterium]|nr:YggS family pyridoxal phosphate-dependent enzyme [Clostridiales bacterium]
MSTNGLKINVDRVKERIAYSCARYEDFSGSKHHVTLVAATKTVPIETVNALIECGVTDIGENRVQEYIAKRDGVVGADWHFIGTLQRNKAKYLVGKVALIQSVSSYALAVEINRIASKLGIVQPVLIELNAAGESAKTGAMPEDVDSLIDNAKKLNNLEVRGLMAVPPIAADDGVYRYVKEVFDNHRDGKFDILSVGMSNDYEKAIMFGSNMVRIGTAIFGQRKTGVNNHE